MIINFLRKLAHRSPAIPRSAGEIGDYRRNFDQAAAFTKSCGFAVAKPAWAFEDALDSEGSFLEPPMRRAGVIDPAMSAGQCLKWCHYLAPEYERQLGRAVWLTIGQLWKGDSVIFSPTWGELKRWSNRGISIAEIQQQGRVGVNLHAWLTIDTGEIIDLTLLSSMAKFVGGGYAKLAGAAVWGRDPGVLNNHRYFPMAIGQAFGESIGMKSELPLLANCAADLNRVPMVLASVEN